MIPAKKFYMIRHGQSETNAKDFFSGNTDVALTDKGRAQATLARKHVEALETKPTLIIHSHLQRARHTAEIINKNLKRPMKENALLGEHNFGDWENKPAEQFRTQLRSGVNPPNGETHEEFATRIKKGINEALATEEQVLIACHGGVFRAFYWFYNNSKNFKPIDNCVLYEFTPDENNTDFPWVIKAQS